MWTYLCIYGYNVSDESNAPCIRKMHWNMSTCTQVKLSSVCGYVLIRFRSSSTHFPTPQTSNQGHLFKALALEFEICNLFFRMGLFRRNSTDTKVRLIFGEHSNNFEKLEIMKFFYVLFFSNCPMFFITLINIEII